MKTRKPSPARTMKASTFKARCLALMDEVANGGGEIVITKNGRPVSRLVPYREKPATLYGIDRDRLRILGEIGPVDIEWEAASDPDRVLDP